MNINTEMNTKKEIATMTDDPAAATPGPKHWGSPERTGAAYDFRSDVVTTPSLSMLHAIARATLHDDVFAEDTTTSLFERQIATICNHEAAAFDARKHAVVTGDVHKCPTRVVSLENTRGGSVIPLGEMIRIKNWAEGVGVKVHLDGARLWEAVAAGAEGIDEFARCADVVMLDFSKNLGAPMGAMVVGSAELIGRLRRLRKSIGGGMRQAGMLAAAARQAVLENFGPGTRDEKGVLGGSHELAREAGRMWEGRGGVLLRAVETNMGWLDLKGAGVSAEEWNEAGRRHGIRVDACGLDWLIMQQNVTWAALGIGR
ncbi:beta-eliminating lyase [Coniochaeta sp. 2T2.1]|nr:beta-eliminating lyase [Coniochaeta sp. 2T2.1]